MSTADPIAEPKPGAGKPGQPGKPAAGGNKLQRWLATHKQQALLGAGAVGAVGIALWRRSQADTTTSTDTGVTGTAIPTSSDGTAGGVYYPSGSDGSYDPIGSVVDLQTSLDALANADAAKLASLSKLADKQQHVLKQIRKQTAPPKGGRVIRLPPIKRGGIGKSGGNGKHPAKHPAQHHPKKGGKRR